MKFNSQKGFTLIELLVVVAIIGMLSSVVLASMNSARKKARDARRLADADAMSTALELYYGDNTSYPNNTLALASSSAAALAPTYMARIPTDPALSGTACGATDKTYCYGTTAALNGYTITIFLEKTGARCRFTEGGDGSASSTPLCSSVI